MRKNILKNGLGCATVFWSGVISIGGEQAGEKWL